MYKEVIDNIADAYQKASPLGNELREMTNFEMGYYPSNDIVASLDALHAFAEEIDEPVLKNYFDDKRDKYFVFYRGLEIFHLERREEDETV